MSQDSESQSGSTIPPQHTAGPWHRCEALRLIAEADGRDAQVSATGEFRIYLFGKYRFSIRCQSRWVNRRIPAFRAWIGRQGDWS